MTQHETPGIVAYPPTSPCWLFPKELYGNAASVSRFASRIAKTGVQQGSLKHVWPSCELKSVLEDDDPIWVSDRSRFFPRKRPLWRLNNVHLALKEEVYQSNNTTLYEKMIEEYLETFWVCVAIATPHAWYGPWGYYDESLAWPKTVLAALLKWLPEFLHINDRIANTTCLETSQLLWKMPSFRFQWAAEILDLCRLIGRKIDIPIDYEDEEWDLIHELWRAGVIEIEGGRTRASWVKPNH